MRERMRFIEAWLLPKVRLILALLIAGGAAGCSGKYLIRSYPPGAKVYIKDLQTQDKRLVGTTPLQITEESRLGDVFMLVLEKQNYKTKELLVRVNEGESLTISSRLDPLDLEEAEKKTNVADNKQQPQQQDDQKPQSQPGPQDQKKKDWQQEIDDLKLRVALLENTADFYKDAIFSARFQGGGPAKFDRDRSDELIGLMFQSQQAIAQGQYDKALESIDKAIEMDEYFANAWLLKGSVKYLQKDYQGAKISWERALKIDPYNKVAYRYLSEVYRRLNLEPLPTRATDFRTPSSIIEIERRRRR